MLPNFSEQEYYAFQQLQFSSSKLLLKRQRGKKLNFKQIMVYDHDLKIYQSIISLSLFGHLFNYLGIFVTQPADFIFLLTLTFQYFFLCIFLTCSLYVIFSTKYQRGQNLTYCLQKEGILEPLISTFSLVIYVKKFCRSKKKVMILDVRKRC